MWAELGFFKDDYGVDVLDGEIFFVEEVGGVFEKLHAVGVFPLRIGVGKVGADVAESRCSEKGVAECVGDDVAVGVAGGAFVEGQMRCRR